MASLRIPTHSIARLVTIPLFLLWSVAAQAQGQAEQNGSLSHRERAMFQHAVDRVAQCVVQIETFGGLEKVDGELVADGPTTGTVVGADGWIISSMFNFRQQPASILVSLADGSRLPARVVARDHSRELVLLKVESKTKLPVPNGTSSSTLIVGQWAIAVGRTFDRESVSQSIGIVSALGRAYGKAIQTDAKISPVNYGGPLIDLEGKVLGILAPISTGGIMEGDSSQIYDSGIGFAVPFDDLAARLERLQAGEDIHSGKLGIVTRQQNELAGPVRVVGASPGSPAAKSGVRSGDLIVAAGNEPIELLSHLRHALGPVDAGQAFRFSVRRNGQLLDLESVLAKEIPVYETRYLGLRVETNEQGLRIGSVELNSPASKAGLKVGWTIQRCSGEIVKSPSDLRTKVAVAELDVPLKMSVNIDSATTKQIEVNVATWPLVISAASTSTTQKNTEVATQILSLPLGDFPNKAAAIVPSTAAMQPSGLVVVVPEPGEFDQQRFAGIWERFAKEQSWIVAYVASAHAKRWSLEEAQLIGRVISKLESSYRIDRSRTAVAGMGAGGRLGLVGARLQGEKVAGVMTLGTRFEGFNWREPNSPSLALKFLFIGQDDIADAVAKLRKLGYAASSIAAPELNPGKMDVLPMGQIEGWLLGLDRI